MFRDIITTLLEITIVLPFIFFFIRKHPSNALLLTLFIAFFLLNQALLRLPRYIPSLDIIGGNWNWDGKLFALAGSTVFYLLFKNPLVPNNFITLKQLKGSLKATVIATVILLVVEILLRILFDKSSSFNYETLAFQLTMPGLDEEFAFRGIMLAFLTTLLSPNIYIGKVNLGNPSSYVVAILFGLIHAFKIDDLWTIHMEWLYFIVTGLIGFLYAWMTIKSRSILMPVISHNLTNFIGNLTSMLK